MHMAVCCVLEISYFMSKENGRLAYVGHLWVLWRNLKNAIMVHVIPTAFSARVPFMPADSGVIMIGYRRQLVQLGCVVDGVKDDDRITAEAM